MIKERISLCRWSWPISAWHISQKNHTTLLDCITEITGWDNLLRVVTGVAYSLSFVIVGMEYHYFVFSPSSKLTVKHCACRNAPLYIIMCFCFCFYFCSHCCLSLLLTMLFFSKMVISFRYYLLCLWLHFHFYHIKNHLLHQRKIHSSGEIDL